MAPPSKATQKPKTSPSPVTEAEEEHATVPVRVSPTVHQYIIAQAAWGESIDRTLRRILKIQKGVKKAANGR